MLGSLFARGESSPGDQPGPTQSSPHLDYLVNRWWASLLSGSQSGVLEVDFMPGMTCLSALEGVFRGKCRRV